MCHVELERRELWVVSAIDALISEDLTNLIDSVEARDNELLQEEFRRNS